MFLWGDKGEYKMNICWLVKSQDTASKRQSHFAPDLGSASGIGSGSFRKWLCEIQSRYLTAPWFVKRRRDSWKIGQAKAAFIGLDILLRIKVPKLPISTYLICTSDLGGLWVLCQGTSSSTVTGICATATRMLLSFQKQLSSIVRDWLSQWTFKYEFKLYSSMFSY